MVDIVSGLCLLVKLFFMTLIAAGLVDDNLAEQCQCKYGRHDAVVAQVEGGDEPLVLLVRSKARGVRLADADQLTVRRYRSIVP